MRLVDSQYLYPPVNTFSTSATAQGTAYAFPIYISQTCYIDQFAVSFSAGATTSNIRFGIYSCDQTGARPGYLYFDSGAYSVVSPGASQKTFNTYYALRPGWWWIACVQQGGTSNTLRTIGAGGLSWPPLMDTAAHAAVAVNGYQIGTGVTGAMPNGSLGLTLSPITTAVVPIVGLGIRTRAQS